MSDCWKAYARLGNFDYTHLTVNHSKNFKDPKTGACTNKIEGLWRHAKHRIPQYRRNKKNFTGYLAKFMFLRKIRQQKLEPLIEFRDVAENKNNWDIIEDN